MKTERFVFEVGPGFLGDTYEVANPPKDWIKVGAALMCTSCGRIVHLVFDSPPDTGFAYCACAPLGNRPFQKEVAR